MTVALAMALRGRMHTQGLKQRDLCRRARMPQSEMSRLLSGGVASPRLGTLLDICRAVQTDPSTLLELAGLWPQEGPPATALDHALLEARRRIEALPLAEKRWALSVVRALMAGVPDQANGAL